MRRYPQPRLISALLAGVLVLLALAVLRQTPTGRQGAASGTAVGTVTFVYDGDTVEVAGVGKVRLIGVDALDAYNEERTLSQAGRYGLSVEQVRRWAGRAAEFARASLLGRGVRLWFGDELYDAYGRTLAYVHVGGSADEGGAGGPGGDFNLVLLERGLAAAYRAFPHPRLEAYLRAEREAQAAGRGMWGDARVRP
ncbi:MAG: hypothetical protein AMK73_05425 [Planctomycetes bacterium SM23_32]|nr:MAG: hypothetical protein AMK73_05425 [Planctomycetes bacterium SM23_32]